MSTSRRGAARRPQPVHAADRSAVVRHVHGPQYRQLPMHGAPFQRWTFPDGSLWAEFHRQGADYLVRFPGLADFTVTGDGRDVYSRPAAGTDRHTVEHLFLNQVEPLALGRQGHWVLHASAVSLGDHAVAFLGVSGRGKSTLAASFAQQGAPFLTDDGLRLQVRGPDLLVLPSHASIRLWQDSQQALAAQAAAAPALAHTPKARLMAGAELPHCDAPLPLRAFYFLGEGETAAVRIEPLRPAETTAQLVRNSFVLDTEDRRALAQHFDAVAAIAARPMHFQLDYPRRYDALAGVRDAVARHAANVSG